MILEAKAPPPALRILRICTMYIDELIYELKRAGVGCYINGEYSDDFEYDDDIVLVFPSLYALNIILMCVNTMHKGLI